jgi:hypothetical protein
VGTCPPFLISINIYNYNIIIILWNPSDSEAILSLIDKLSLLFDFTRIKAMAFRRRIRTETRADGCFEVRVESGGQRRWEVGGGGLSLIDR